MVDGEDLLKGPLLDDQNNASIVSFRDMRRRRGWGRQLSGSMDMYRVSLLYIPFFSGIMLDTSMRIISLHCAISLI